MYTYCYIILFNYNSIRRLNQSLRASLNFSDTVFNASSSSLPSAIKVISSPHLTPDASIDITLFALAVLPSAYSNDKFGNLFESECEEDEILLSSASIDDVQIITKITEHNIRIGE